VEASQGRPLQPWAKLWCGDLEDLWGGLAQSIRERRSVREICGIAASFKHLAQDAKRAAGFNRAMASNTYWVARAFAACELLSGVRCLFDVGGGQGALLAAALQAHPKLRGILFDLPHTASAASNFLAQRGLVDGTQFVAGSFFESVPRGGDAYVLKTVLHDWGDDECLAILRQCRSAMGPADRLFTIERLLQSPTVAGYDSRAWARSDLNMLVTRVARERRRGEYADHAAWRRVRVDPDLAARHGAHRHCGEHGLIGVHAASIGTGYPKAAVSSVGV
jgi:O-methyltransferase domain